MNHVKAPRHIFGTTKKVKSNAPSFIGFYGTKNQEINYEWPSIMTYYKYIYSEEEKKECNVF